MSEFDVGGHTYRVSKMPVKLQMLILKRLTPLMGALDGRLALGEGQTFGALAKAIDMLSDESIDLIYHECLSTVDRRQGENGWAKIKVGRGDALQFHDIDLLATLQILSNVLRENYEALFRAGLDQLGVEAAQAN